MMPGRSAAGVDPESTRPGLPFGDQSSQLQRSCQKGPGPKFALSQSDDRARVQDQALCRFGDFSSRAAHSRRPSRLDIPRFQPGETVPVRYDPQNPARVALDVYHYK